jgi:hypothetical protein
VTSRLTTANLSPDWLSITASAAPGSTASTDQPAFAAQAVKTQWTMDALGNVTLTVLDGAGRTVETISPLFS